MTIPTFEQPMNVETLPGSGNYPLNISNVQVHEETLFTPLGEVPAPDLTVVNSSFDTTPTTGAECPSYKMTTTIANQGDADIDTEIFYYIYDNDPTVATPTPNLIVQLSNTLTIAAGDQEDVVLEFTVPASSLPLSNIYLIVNTNPNMTVPITNEDYDDSYPECNYENNITNIVLPSCCNIDTTNATVTSSNPTTCTPGTEGSITVTNAGLEPNTTYLVDYNINGVAATQTSVTTNASGVLRNYRFRSR